MILSYSAEQVRRLDHDRFLTALFAPADRREALFALYAFNTEVARVREAVSEPTLGRIRLQWWREALDEIAAGGAVRAHPVAEALAETIRARALPRAPFDRLIDAREADLDDAPPASLAALEAYAADTGATLSELACHVLGANDPETVAAARSVGTAWALTGLLRALPFHARRRRSVIPAETAAAAGAQSRDLFALRATPELADACRAIADLARARLADARGARPRPPKAALPALLPAVLADRYLARMARRGHDVISRPVEVAGPRQQMALMGAALRRRF